MIKALITLMALVVFCTTLYAEEKAHDWDDQNYYMLAIRCKTPDAKGQFQLFYCMGRNGEINVNIPSRPEAGVRYNMLTLVQEKGSISSLKYYLSKSEINNTVASVYNGGNVVNAVFMIEIYHVVKGKSKLKRRYRANDSQWATWRTK